MCKTISKSSINMSLQTLKAMSPCVLNAIKNETNSCIIPELINISFNFINNNPDALWDFSWDNCWDYSVEQCNCNCNCNSTYNYNSNCISQPYDICLKQSSYKCYK